MNNLKLKTNKIIILCYNRLFHILPVDNLLSVTDYLMCLEEYKQIENVLKVY